MTSLKMNRKLFPKIFSLCHEHLSLPKETHDSIARCLQNRYRVRCPTHRKHLISRNHGYFPSNPVFQDSALKNSRFLETCVNFCSYTNHPDTNKPMKSLKILIKHRQQDETQRESNQTLHISNADETHTARESAILTRFGKKETCRSGWDKSVKPISVPLHDLNQNRTEYHFTYVPILKTLKLMMEQRDVQRMCASYPYENGTNGYFDISDGEVVKNNKFFSTNPDALKIVLFQDSFEASFPVFVDKVKFKLIGIYMTLANLPPHIRNRKENIKLVLLCFENFVITFGWEQVLRNLISDMKILETEGISYSAFGRITRVKGSLIALTGDNNGSNSIGGFVKNFSSTQYFSRYCETTLSDLRGNVIGTEKLRTIQSYNRCAEEAEFSGEMVKGIRNNSPLNALNYFHVCNPGLPPCCGHDLFEGLAREDILNSTAYFVKQQWLHLSEVNIAIKQIQKSMKLRIRLPRLKDWYARGYVGSATEIKLMLMLFPLIIGDQIKDRENNVWRMILKLRQVCDLVSSPALTPKQVDNLHDKIVEYLNLRVTCFPEISIKPKHLFVQHYPTMIRKFGPLIHMWTAGFEEKHGVMRDLIKECDNYGDVTNFVAEKHELEKSNVPDQYSDWTVIENPVVFERKEFEEKFDVTVPVYGENDFKYMCKKVRFRDIDYEENKCICVGLDESKNLMICKIHAILVNEEKTDICFVGKMKTIKYNCDTGLYENYGPDFSEDQHYQCYPYSTLISFKPLIESSMDSKPVYITHYSPFGLTF